MPVNTDGMQAIDDLIRWHREKYGTAQKKRPLFPSRQGKRPEPISRLTTHLKLFYTAVYSRAVPLRYQPVPRRLLIFILCFAIR